MITICAAASQYIEGVAEYEDISDIFIDSVIENLSNVNEIILVFQGKESEETQEEINGVLIRRFFIPDQTRFYNHPVSLHLAIDHAKNDWVMFSDIDTFYLSDCSKIYLDLATQYGLAFVGVQHYIVSEQAFLDFPTVISFLTNKKYLPSKSWLKGRIRKIDREHYSSEAWEEAPVWDGYYLFPIPSFDLSAIYPQPNKNFDIGCSLYLWAHEKNLHWLSFASPDGNMYFQNEFSSNTLIEPQPKNPLVFHRNSQSPSWKIYRQYREIYLSYKKGKLM